MRLPRRRIVSLPASGFSLPELIVSVGVMGLVSAGIVTTVFNRMPTYRLEQAAGQLLTDLRRARMLAASRNLDARITFNGERKQYSIWTDLNGDGDQDSGEVEMKSLEGNQQLGMWTYPDSGTFHPNGTFSSGWSYGYIRVYMPKAGYRYIHVLPSGHVNLSEI
jgi:prepilin-type N-terminal cleavage/methylation domain-containing protein